MLLDLPGMPNGIYHKLPANPFCYLVYADVLGSVFELHCDPCFRDYYEKYADQLAQTAKRIPNHELYIGSIKRLPVTQRRSLEAEKFLFDFTVCLTGSSSAGQFRAIFMF